MDVGFSLPPVPSGKYTLVAAAGVKEGDEIDKALRAVHVVAPPDAQQFVTLDAEKVGAVAIHRFEPPTEVIDPEIKRLLGDGPAYIAVRKHAVLVAAGDKVLDALKEVLAREPKAGKLLYVEGSVAGWRRSTRRKRPVPWRPRFSPRIA